MDKATKSNSSELSIGEDIDELLTNIFRQDPYLEPYEDFIRRRIFRIRGRERKLTQGKMDLADFASGHDYFGLHFECNEWVVREWAPNASAIYLISSINNWQKQNNFAMQRIDNNGVWEIRLPLEMLQHGDLYRLKVCWPEGEGDRIPSYARRVMQDPETLIFNAQVWFPEPYPWRCNAFKAPTEPVLIYEAHVGMAQEEGKVGTFTEFTDKVLPRIVESGYNTLQLMAIQEHPYYGSFGYHVSNFFAVSSRFGTPENLKNLIDTAHASGLRVIMDIVHSHAVNNEVEGLSRFDGTIYQYFHNGPRGAHIAWDSRCFDYGRQQVIHFLLSNCRFWLDEYRFDGFRFDGITSMLYDHHGLGEAFTSYDHYFNKSVDEDALVYLALANKLIHEVNPNAITIAEDISGMPGLALSVPEGGYGFDYRLAMGTPDLWIKLIKEYPDEEWPMGQLWYELNNRRQDEKSIGYAESHDQALVGDKTMIFRMIGKDIYHHMSVDNDNMQVDRGIALHKLIRLITLATAGNGYLNFIGNEFGHPEWVDFPREGNGWSYHYARRQWHLTDDSQLKYQYLHRFDRDMISLAKKHNLFQSKWPYLWHEHNEDKVIAFSRGQLLFAFNFHPTRSYTDYCIKVAPGKLKMILDSDTGIYGGHGRLVSDQIHFTIKPSSNGDGEHMLSLYLPTRTALILKKEN